MENVVLFDLEKEVDEFGRYTTDGLRELGILMDKFGIHAQVKKILDRVLMPCEDSIMYVYKVEQLEGGDLILELEVGSCNCADIIEMEQYGYMVQGHGRVVRVRVIREICEKL